MVILRMVYLTFNIGISDIKNHRFLAPISFSNILAKKVNPPYVPTIKKDDDTSNFAKFDDSNS